MKSSKCRYGMYVNCESAYIERYNLWVDIIKCNISLVIPKAKEFLAHECIGFRIKDADCWGWHIGSNQVGCYRTNVYLLSDGTLAEQHYFISNNQCIDLSHTKTYVEKDYYDMGQIFKYVLNFGTKLGVEHSFARSLI